MIQFPFIEPSQNDPHPPTNLYFTADAWNGLPGLRAFPGLTEFVDFGNGEIRGGIVVGDYLYAVVGANVYKISSDGSYTKIKNNMATSTGIVDISNDSQYITITDGANGYVITIATNTMAAISDADFPTPSGSTYQDGYVIITAKDTNYFYISDLNDPTSWVATEREDADYNWDYATRPISVKRVLYIFGSKSIEAYYNSGDADFPFLRIDTGIIDYGTPARDSISAAGESVFFFANDMTIKQLVGFSTQIISTPTLNERFSGYSTVSDARGFAFEYFGNLFYSISFPTEDESWVYNSATGQWHQWAYGEDLVRTRANCYFFFNNRHYVGDRDNGKVYQLDKDNFTDDDATIKRIRRTPVINSAREFMVFGSLELWVKNGVGLSADHSTLGVGTDPQGMLRWSNDMGRTWSPERWRSLGKIGEYNQRVRWDMLGSGFQREFEFSVTDPVDVRIVGAFLT
jgi:hypothetical protein